MRQKWPVRKQKNVLQSGANQASSLAGENRICGIRGKGKHEQRNGADMYELWPWFVLAGLGAFHGANPAMGWLFAVALGLHEGSLTAVLRALPPIALGHAASIVIVAGLVMLSGVVIRGDWIYEIAGALLIGCSARCQRRIALES